MRAAAKSLLVSAVFELIYRVLAGLRRMSMGNGGR